MTMKRLTVSLGIAVALAALMSSTVLAHPAAPGEAITAICECLGGLDSSDLVLLLRAVFCS